MILLKVLHLHTFSKMTDVALNILPFCVVVNGADRLTTTDNGFCCESLRQFCRESQFTVNALRQLTMAFAANLCGSSVANLLQ